MEDITQEQAHQLLDAAYHTIPGSDALLSQVRRRHARRRAGIRGTLAAGTTSLIAGGAIVALTATGAPSAYAAVSSAVTKTAATSFHVNLAITSSNLKGWPGSSPFKMTGAFDLARHAGQEVLSNGWQMRFVGHHGYLKLPRLPAAPGKPWAEQPLLPSGLAASELASSYNSDRLVNPAVMLKLLKSGGQIRDEGPASGPGWTGTRYGFTVRHPADVIQVITGTIAVDSDGQLRQLDQTVTFVPLHSAPGQPADPAGTLTVNYAFSDFGAPVSVSAPPPQQVEPYKGVILGVDF